MPQKSRSHVHSQSAPPRGHGVGAPSVRELRAAHEAWKRLGVLAGERAQFELLEELLATRRPELVRAYPGVVDVTIGYGTYRTRKPRGKQSLAQRRVARRRADEALGITFLVRRKVQDPTKLGPAGVIPQFLLTYATIEGERTLCAVATDVESLDEYRAVAHSAARYVFVTRSSSEDPWSQGAAACLVTIPGLPAARQFLLSCLHLFGMSADDIKNGETVGKPDNRWVRVRGVNGELIAVVTGHYGGLRRAPWMSFDAALADVRDRERAGQVIAVHPTRFATNYFDIPQQVKVHTPRGAISASKTILLGAFTIRHGKLGERQHGPLIEVLGNSPLIEGDSGSAVTDDSGDLLVGMHIAGIKGSRKGYMIPAYDLLELKNFKDLGAVGGQEYLQFA